MKQAYPSWNPLRKCFGSVSAILYDTLLRALVNHHISNFDDGVGQPEDNCAEEPKER